MAEKMVVNKKLVFLEIFVFFNLRLRFAKSHSTVIGNRNGTGHSLSIKQPRIVFDQAGAKTIVLAALGRVQEAKATLEEASAL